MGLLHYLRDQGHDIPYHHPVFLLLGRGKFADRPVICCDTYELLLGQSRARRRFIHDLGRGISPECADM